MKIFLEISFSSIKRSRKLYKLIILNKIFRHFFQMCYVNLWKEGIKMGNNILIMSLSNNLENNIKKAKKTKKE